MVDTTHVKHVCVVNTTRVWSTNKLIVGSFTIGPGIHFVVATAARCAICLIRYTCNYELAYESA